MIEVPEEGVFDSKKGAVFLQGWRASLDISQSEAAEKLDISTEAYADYEAGDAALPIKIILACRALSKGITKETLSLSRDRWVTTVENMRNYLAGKEVVGEMILEKRWQELRDFMDLVRIGPEPELAMTDPSLFIMLRKAGTKAFLSGLMLFRGPSPNLVNSPDAPENDSKSGREP